MSCAVCGKVVGLNKVYGDQEFCPEHSEKDLEEMQKAKEDAEVVATQAKDATLKKEAKQVIEEFD